MRLGFLTDGRVADVHFARTEGFDCLELALFGETPLLNDRRELVQALAGEGVGLAAVSLFGQNYFCPETGAGRLGLLERVVDLTVALGAPVVVLGTGTPPGAHGRDRVLAAVERLKPTIERAQAAGLKVAFYNCHWENWIDRPEAWRIALPLLPGVGVKFDPSHPIQGRREWKHDLLHAGPHLLHAHAKDVLEVDGEFVADPNPGLGSVRWEEFFGLLYHAGYDGAVCIEPHSPLYVGERRHDFLRLSGRYLRRFLL